MSHYRLSLKSTPPLISLPTKAWNQRPAPLASLSKYPLRSFTTHQAPATSAPEPFYGLSAVLAAAHNWVLLTVRSRPK